MLSALLLANAILPRFTVAEAPGVRVPVQLTGDWATLFTFQFSVALVRLAEPMLRRVTASTWLPLAQTVPVGAATPVTAASLAPPPVNSYAPGSGAALRAAPERSVGTSAMLTPVLFRIQFCGVT